jgi:hypothetical protein
MRMLRNRLRRWLREEGLMTTVALVICLPLLLLAVSNAGHRGNVGRTYNPNRLDLR